MDKDLETVMEANRQHILKTEEFLRLRIKPKPKYWSKKRWHKMLNKLIVLERSGIRFSEPGEE